MSASGAVSKVDPDTLAALRDHLLAYSVKTGHFTLKSGRTSTWFIDSKQTVCRPEAMAWVAEAVLALTPAEATAIGGLTMGADPVAFVTAGVGATRGRPLKAFSVRKEAKDHGAGGRIAGALDPQDRVVVTEDTVTRGTSLLEAARVVRGRVPGRGRSGAGRPGRHGRGDGGCPGNSLLRGPACAGPGVSLRGSVKVARIRGASPGVRTTEPVPEGVISTSATSHQNRFGSTEL